MIRILVVFGVGCFGMVLSGCASGRSAGKTNQHPVTFKRMVTGDYQVFLPPGYDKSDHKWPLVVFLHGAGGGTTIGTVVEGGLPGLAGRYADFPFVLVSPRCPTRGWGSMLTTLNVMLNEVLEKYKVDPNRVYLTGLSMGGNGTWTWASANPERFAAAVPICGGGRTQLVQQMKGIPVWAFHGEKDDLVPLQQTVDTVDALKKAEGNVKLTIYPGVGHGSWVPAYNTPELYVWMLQHRRDGRKVVEDPAEALPEELLRNLGFQGIADGAAFVEVTGAADPVEGLTFSLPLQNPTDRPVDVDLAWEMGKTASWTVTPDKQKMTLKPGEQASIKFSARPAGQMFPLPMCAVNFSTGTFTEKRQIKAPVDVDGYLLARRPTIVAKRAATAPVIDGKLDDPAWQRPADTLEFRSPGCDPMPLKVQGWITYDDTCCYVAIRSQEPRLDLLTCKVKERDAAVYSDDCVEFFLNVDREKNEYYQFVVNPAGVVYDSLRRDGSVNTSVKAAAGREAAAWTVELAIPWADVKVAPPLKASSSASCSRAPAPPRQKTTPC